MSIVSLLILILFFIICIFVKFYTIQPSSCNSITNKLSIYLILVFGGPSKRALGYAALFHFKIFMVSGQGRKHKNQDQ